MLEHDFHSFHIEELKVLAQFFRNQYLPYDNIHLHEVVNRISAIVEQNELANRPSSSTQGS
jgi:hypothetical protein